MKLQLCNASDQDLKCLRSIVILNLCGPCALQQCVAMDFTVVGDATVNGAGQVDILLRVIGGYCALSLNWHMTSIQHGNYIYKLLISECFQPWKQHVITSVVRIGPGFQSNSPGPWTETIEMSVALSFQRPGEPL
jgi:hypothetical protein